MGNLKDNEKAPHKQPGDVVAYLDVGAGGYLDLGSELSEDALQQLPKGRHALVIAGTYGIDGYVAAPHPAAMTLADSQPAPVPTRTFFERMLAAMEGVIDVADRQTDEFEALRSCVIDLTVLLFSKSAPARDYPPLPMQFACSGVFPVYSADQMRAYVDADRAARATADSVPVWANQAVIEYRYTGGTHWCPLGPAERMKPNFDGMYRLQGGVFPVDAPADSVLEDAADPLQGAANWLVKAHSGLETSTLAGKLSIGYNRAKRLHDAAIAARKQGGV